MGQTKSDIWEKVKKSKWWIIGAAGVILLAVVLRIVFNPAIHYSKGEKLFDSGKFSAAAEQFSAAGDYKDAASKAKRATAAQSYADGEAKFNAGDYTAASALFTAAAGYEDAAERVRQSQLGVHYKAAETAFANGDYPSAISEFEQAENFQDAAEQVLASTYALADENEKKEEYAKAIEEFDSIGDYSDAKERIFAIGLARLNANDFSLAEKAFETGGSSQSEDYYYYTQGKELFSRKKYSDAKEQFKKCAVEDAADLCTACDYLTAEEHYQNGELNTAKKLFEALPKDYSYKNGAKVGVRLERLEKFKSFAALCGTWKVTDNYIESKNDYNRSGSWSNGDYDSVLTDQSITIRCVINSDDTVTVNGEVEFYRFTDYSSLKEYCKATKTSKTFSITKVAQMPASHVIDGDTTLLFKNNIFELSYYVKDNYSVSFTNMYTSRVTYGKLGSSL